MNVCHIILWQIIQQNGDSGAEGVLMQLSTSSGGGIKQWLWGNKHPGPLLPFPTLEAGLFGTPFVALSLNCLFSLKCSCRLEESPRVFLGPRLAFACY